MSEGNRPRIRIIVRAKQTSRILQSTGLPGDNQATLIENHEPTDCEMPNFENGLNCDKDEVTLVEKIDSHAMPAQLRSRGPGQTSNAGSQSKSCLETESQEINAAITASLQSWVEKYVEDRLTAERTKRDQEVEFLKEQLSKSEERERRNAEKSTDDTIKGKWQTMGYNIRNIVYMMRGYNLKDERSVVLALQVRLPEASFDNVPEDAKRDAFEQFMGAYIWHFVYIDILSGGGCQWRSNVVNLVQAAKRDIISNEEDPQRRAGLASWFSEGGKETAAQVNPELQQTMIDLFTDSLLWVFQTYQSEENIEQAKSLISEIVQDATELAIMFMSSKALLIPHWPFYGQHGRSWNIEEFDTHTLTFNGTHNWRMVVRPALEKYGNADGEKHDVSRVLCKPVMLQICRNG